MLKMLLKGTQTIYPTKRRNRKSDLSNVPKYNDNILGKGEHDGRS